jgi:hypothetical protein
MSVSTGSDVGEVDLTATAADAVISSLCGMIPRVARAMRGDAPRRTIKSSNLAVAVAKRCAGAGTNGRAMIGVAGCARSSASLRAYALNMGRPSVC